MARPVKAGEKATRRCVTVTDTSWQGVLDRAESLGFDSRSALIEAIGKGEIEIVRSGGTLAERFDQAVGRLTVLIPLVRKRLDP